MGKHRRYTELKYDWDSPGGRQGYTFGGTTPTSAVTYQVYSSGLGDGCWNRFTSTQGWDQYCKSGFNQGHPSIQATTNSASNDATKNSIVGIFTTVQYKPSPTQNFADFSNDNGGKYCREYGDSSTYGKVEYISTVPNQIKTGDSASTNSCSGIRDGAAYDLPG